MPQISLTSGEHKAVYETLKDRRDACGRMYAMLHRSNPDRAKLETEESVLTGVLEKFRKAEAKRTHVTHADRQT